MPNSLAPALANRRGHVAARSSDDHAELVRRQRLYTFLQEHPVVGVKQGEVDTHFATMPSRYWERVTKADLAWDLETVSTFLRKSSGSDASASAVVADSRSYPERSVTKILVCSWDRPGLLAKISAAFTALRINILRADIYTRADGVALDSFDVSIPEHNPVAEEERLRHLVFLLEGAMSDPPRFVSIWAGEFHKTMPRQPGAAPKIVFDNNRSDDYTVVQVEAQDRLGLLHDLLRSLTECGLNVAEALVDTEAGAASDAFYLTDLNGGKLLDPLRLDTIRKALTRAIGA